MARVNVETRALAESRLRTLAKLMNWDEAQALGTLVFLWGDSQELKKIKATKKEILRWSRCRPEDEDRLFEALLEAPYITPTKRSDLYEIRGNMKQVGSLLMFSEKAQKAGLASGESRRKKRDQNLNLRDQNLNLTATVQQENKSSSRTNLENSSDFKEIELQVQKIEPNTIQYNSTQYNSTQLNTKDKDTHTSVCTDHPLKRIWNENCGTLPKCKALSSNRKRSTDARWREHPDEAYWIKIVQRIKASAFCNGNSDSAWVATYDWFVKPDTHVRALEGKYDDRDRQDFYLTPEMKRAHNNNLRFKQSTGKSIREFLSGETDTPEQDARPVEPDL